MVDTAVQDGLVVVLFAAAAAIIPYVILQFCSLFIFRGSYCYRRVFESD